MKRLTLGAILLLFGYIAGCDALVGDNSEPTDDLYPLEVGNSWSYLHTSHRNDSLNMIDTVSVEIVGTEVIEFEGSELEVFVQRTTHSSDPSRSWTMSLRRESDGLYRYGFASGTATTYRKQLLIRFPAVEGDSWRFITVIMQTNTSTNRLTHSLQLRQVRSTFIKRAPEEKAVGKPIITTPRAWDMSVSKVRSKTRAACTRSARFFCNTL